MPAFKTARANTIWFWCWQAHGQLVGFLSGAAGAWVPVRLAVSGLSYKIRQCQPRLARIIGQFIAVVIALV
jgi:hypothetical protein